MSRSTLHCSRRRSEVDQRGGRMLCRGDPHAVEVTQSVRQRRRPDDVLHGVGLYRLLASNPRSAPQAAQQVSLVAACCTVQHGCVEARLAATASVTCSRCLGHCAGYAQQVQRQGCLVA